jgi:hypothetical protein
MVIQVEMDFEKLAGMSDVLFEIARSGEPCRPDIEHRQRLPMPWDTIKGTFQDD